MQTLYIVVPCYNEEPVLRETAGRLKSKMTALMASGKIGKASRVLFVDDGSKDATWRIIEELHQGDPLFSGVKLSRNQGHQNALRAGLMTAMVRCDVSISMDADLQDDIDAVDEMLEKYLQGYDVVYGVRSERATDTRFKRVTAERFYRFMQLMGVSIVFNHADYRLMSQRALTALSEYKEVNLFLRGMVPLVGYKSATVSYKRGERFAGESKYPLKKMLAFALDGITSFSIKPIRVITVLGVAIFLISILMILIFILQKLTGKTDSGWASIICSIWAIGGIQLFSLGIIGEYVGKIYGEVKHRPHYILEAVLESLPEEDV